jgi:hypothetical protein
MRISTFPRWSQRRYAVTVSPTDPNAVAGECPPALTERSKTMATLLWIIAVILVIAGIVALFRRQILWGVVLIILGLLVGPGGVSLFT